MNVLLIALLAIVLGPILMSLAFLVIALPMPGVVEDDPDQCAWCAGTGKISGGMDACPTCEMRKQKQLRKE